MENERTEENVWNYGDESTLGADMAGAVDVTGWSVEAVDGGSARLTRQPMKWGSSYIVIDTGVWIFGKKVMVPRRDRGGPLRGRQYLNAACCWRKNPIASSAKRSSSPS